MLINIDTTKEFNLSFYHKISLDYARWGDENLHVINYILKNAENFEKNSDSRTIIYCFKLILDIIRDKMESKFKVLMLLEELDFSFISTISPETLFDLTKFILNESRDSEFYILLKIFSKENFYYFLYPKLSLSSFYNYYFARKDAIFIELLRTILRNNEHFYESDQIFIFEYLLNSDFVDADVVVELFSLLVVKNNFNNELLDRYNLQMILENTLSAKILWPDIHVLILYKHFFSTNIFLMTQHVRDLFIDNVLIMNDFSISRLDCAMEMINSDTKLAILYVSKMFFCRMLDIYLSGSFSRKKKLAYFYTRILRVVPIRLIESVFNDKHLLLLHNFIMIDDDEILNSITLIISSVIYVCGNDIATLKSIEEIVTGIRDRGNIKKRDETIISNILGIIDEKILFLDH